MPTNSINATDLFNLFSSISSLILSVLAIWMSLYFYNKSKDSEKQVSLLLMETKTNVEGLQKLHGKMIDRLTRYATDGNPSHQVVEQMVTLVKEFPVSVVNLLKIPEKSSKAEEYFSELVSSYIAIYYYSVLTNVFAQFSIPKASDYNSDDYVHQAIVKTVNTSARDVEFMEGIIAKLSNTQLQQSPYYHLYQEVQSIWRSLVKDAASAMAHKAQHGT